MKRCIACDKSYAYSLEKCPVCGAGPVIVDGFLAYAPELASSGSGFKSNYFSALARLEDGSFWFRSRNKLILWALSKYCPDFQSLLEIGCGTGYVLSGIAKTYANANLYGSEIFTKGLGFAAARVPTASLVQMDARRLPYIDEFDVIGAFDVLEHIEEDQQVLAQMHAALKPGGIILITVPQHPWLWSATDNRACHIRRYTETDIRRKIEMAGFRIMRSTSFITILLPVMMISRLRKRKIALDENDRAELEIKPWLNSIFIALLSIEMACIKMGFSLPLGGSRLVIAKK